MEHTMKTTTATMATGERYDAGMARAVLTDAGWLVAVSASERRKYIARGRKGDARMRREVDAAHATAVAEVEAALGVPYAETTAAMISAGELVVGRDVVATFSAGGAA
jgi:hypothetical protein